MYHGAKWQWWKLANPNGSMKEFRRYCERKAARVCDEMRVFWRRQDSLGVDDDPLVSSAESAALPAEASYESSSESLDEYEVVEREYLKLMTVGASDEELLEWATCTEVWDFVP